MKKQRKFLGLVAELGCMITGTPAEIHHVRKYGERRDDRMVIPLSPHYHRTGGLGIAIHAGRKTWVKNYGSDVEMVREVYKRLGIEPDSDVKGWLKRYGE